MLDLSVLEPLCILLYPDRTEVIFQERRQVVSKRTRTISGELARARTVAQECRDLGLRVSVYRGVNQGHDRVFVEIGHPTEDGKRGAKQTRLFPTEREVVRYLKGARDDLAKAGER